MRSLRDAGRADPQPATDRYLPVFVLLLAILGVVSFVDETGPLRVGVHLAVVLVVVASLRAAGPPLNRTGQLLLGGGLLALVAVAGGIADFRVSTVTATVLVALALGFAAYRLVRRIFEHSEIGPHQVVAAFTAYLEVALVYALLFSAAATASDDAFFLGGRSGQLGDFVYFSIVTITTLGFGDLAPATNLGRSLVMIETVSGQVILVVLIAYLVGRLGTGRREAT